MDRQEKSHSHGIIFHDKRGKELFRFRIFSPDVGLKLRVFYCSVQVDFSSNKELRLLVKQMLAFETPCSAMNILAQKLAKKLIFLQSVQAN